MLHKCPRLTCLSILHSIKLVILHVIKGGVQYPIGSFFQDELVHYNPPEFYEIDILDTRGKGKKKEYLVHYRGYPNTYDEWKKASDMKKM